MNVTSVIENSFNNITFHDNVTSNMSDIAVKTGNPYIVDVRIYWLHHSIRMIQGVLCLLKNTLTLVAIAKFEFLHTPTNILIASLACADFLAGLFPFQTILSNMSQHWRHFVPLCKVTETIKLVTVSANLHNILLITLDRLFNIAFPLWYELQEWRSTCGFVKIVLGVWAYTWVSCGLCIGLGTVMERGRICYYVVNLFPEVYQFLAGYLIAALSVFIVCYAAMGMIALRHRRAIQSLQVHITLGELQTNQIASNKVTTGTQTTNADSKDVDESSVPRYVTGEVTYENNIKNEPEASTSKMADVTEANKINNKPRGNITKMLSIILGVYLFCTLPAFISGVLINYMYGKGPVFLFYLDFINAIIYWSQSYLNAGIYAWKSKDFRRAFKKLLGMKPNDVAPFV